MKINGKVQYLFRRPEFPIVCAVGEELISAGSPAAFQRQVERLDLEGSEVLDIVDATGEAWAFHVDLIVVSPLTFKKRWTKSAVIRLFNESNNARRIGGAYPETSLSGKTLRRVVTDVAALAAYAKPNRPLQRTGARGARPARGAPALAAGNGLPRSRGAVEDSPRNRVQDAALTKVLEEVFKEASKLSEAQQDALAEAIRAKIRAEKDRDESFASSLDVLEHLADEAIADHRAGRTEPVDPDKM